MSRSSRVSTTPSSANLRVPLPARAVLVDQSRTGIHSPAAFLDLTGPLRSLYAASEDAQALGLGAEALAASCSACAGRGVITLDMGFLPDVHVPCETCRGTGYLPEAWQIRVAGLALPEVFGLTIDQAYEVFAEPRRSAAPSPARGSSGWATWCCASRAMRCPAAKRSG